MGTPHASREYTAFNEAEVAVEDCRVRKVVAVEVNVGPRRESRVVVAEPELCFVRGGAIPDEMGCGRMPEAVEANPGSARIRVLTPFTRLRPPAHHTTGAKTRSHLQIGRFRLRDLSFGTPQGLPKRNLSESNDGP